MSKGGNGDSISEEDFEVVYTIRLIGAILSICSSLFLILLYAILCSKTRCKKKKNKNLLLSLMLNSDNPGSFSDNFEPINTSVNRWTNRKQKTKYRIGLGNDLLLGYAISSIVFSSSLLIKIYYSSDSSEYGPFCKTQAFLKTFGGLSVFTWIFCVSHSFLLSVRLTDFEQIKIYFFIYPTISLVLPLIISLIPLFINEYGWGISICGFDLNSEGSTWFKILQSVVFVYNLIFLIFQLVCSIKVHFYFAQRFNEISNDPTKIKEINFIKHYRILIWVVPILMLIFVSTSMYNVFTDMIGYNKEYFLNGHNILLSLSNFVMSTVFVFYFRQVLPLVFCCLKQKDEEIPPTSKGVDTSTSQMMIIAEE